MGRITTVYPYGAHDVVRNPALLSCQNQDHSFGILLDYQISAFDDIGQVTNSTSVTKTNLSTSEHPKAYFDYAGTSNFLSFGFSFYDQYDLVKTSQKILLFNNPPSAGPGNPTQISFYKTFTFAFSVPISENNFLGIQLFNTYYGNLYKLPFFYF